MSISLTTTAQPSPPERRRSHWPWAIAAVLLALIIAIAVPVWYVVFRAADAADKLAAVPGTAVDRLAEAFRPHTSVTTVIHTSISNLREQAKLVVLSANITATVRKESASSWGYISMGTTSVRLTVAGNKIQYYVPLDKIAANNFSFDEDTRTLIVHIPDPLLDRDMVEVQTDPKQIDVETNNGWAKLDTYSGAPLREEARGELRDAVILQGSSILVHDQARKNAVEAVRNLLTPLTQALANDVKLEVQLH